MMEGVIVTPLKVIQGELGNVMHALKQSDPEFHSFGEAYFSTINKGSVKGWKKHQRMILNLIVPVGKIKFTVFDDRLESFFKNTYFDVVLSSSENYARLTIHPGLWVAFEGMEEVNILLNLASIEHDPMEAENSPIELGIIKYLQ
jgi:dTDP-4-dehydrorhamnose 3,5-epimerase